MAHVYHKWSVKKRTLEISYSCIPWSQCCGVIGSAVAAGVLLRCLVKPNFRFALGLKLHLRPFLVRKMVKLFFRRLVDSALQEELQIALAESKVDRVFQHNSTN
jgi:hypothetical protein